MTLDALRCFVAVVQSGGFHRAASALKLTQPAISQQIKALEAEAGGRLLDRKSGTLSPRGKLLYEEARILLARADSAVKKLHEFDEAAHAELRVGSSDTTATYTLPKVVRRFLKDMPQTRLILLNRNSSAIEAELLEGLLDLGIVTAHAGHKDLDYEELFQQQFVAVLPAKHPLAQRKTLKLEHIAEENLLLLDASTRSGRAIYRCFEDAGLKPKVLLDSGSFDVIKAYILTGLGISIFPQVMLEQKVSGLRAVKVQGLPNIPVGLLWKKGAYLGKGGMHFTTLLKAHLAIKK